MGTGFLIDTNILIYHLAGDIPLDAKPEIRRILTESFNVSVITEIELLGWRKLNTEEIEKIKIVLSTATVFYIDQEIKEKAIEIRRLLNLKLPDSVIAATALVNDLTLITRNVKDFEKIEELIVYNPFES